jgi:hypothetical protein
VFDSKKAAVGIEPTNKGFAVKEVCSNKFFEKGRVRFYWHFMHFTIVKDGRVLADLAEL